MFRGCRLHREHGQLLLLLVRTKYVSQTYLGDRRVLLLRRLTLYLLAKTPRKEEVRVSVCVDIPLLFITWTFSGTPERPQADPGVTD